MLYIRDICNLAAARVGVLTLGQNLDPDTGNLIFNIFNPMIDEFSIRSINYHPYDYTVSASNPIILGTDINTGISGNIPTLPAEIREVIAIINNVNYKLNMKRFDEYISIPILLNAIPEAVYIKYDFPFMTLNFFPGFNQNAFVRILGRSYLTSETLTINDYTNLPREFNQFLVSQLALRISPYFGFSAAPGLIIEANDALKHLKERELLRTLTPLQNDMGNYGGFDYMTGLAGII